MSSLFNVQCMYYCTVRCFYVYDSVRNSTYEYMVKCNETMYVAITFSYFFTK